MDTLITIIIFLLISVVAGWLNKRAQKKQAEDSWPGEETTASEPPAPKAGSWEEELRRLLEGESAPPPAPPPRQPPVIVIERPRPKPPPMRPAPVIETLPPEPDWSLPAPIEPASGRVASFETASQAYQKAVRFSDRVAERMLHMRDLRGGGTRTQYGVTRPPEAEQVVQLLRHPRTARQAIIASVILSPPKGMETAQTFI